MISRIIVGMVAFLALSVAGAAEVSFYSYSDAVEMAGSSGKMVYVLFGSDYCPWCERQKEVLVDPKVASELDSYVICYVDVSAEESLAKKYRVKTIPVNMVIRSDERVVKKDVGYMEVKKFLDWIR